MCVYEGGGYNIYVHANMSIIDIDVIPFYFITYIYYTGRRSNNKKLPCLSEVKVKETIAET